MAKCVRMWGFAFHSGKLVRFFRNDSESQEREIYRVKIQFPAGGHGPGFRGARCFGNLSPLIRARLSDEYKQTLTASRFSHKTWTCSCVARLTIFNFSLPLVVILRNSCSSKTSSKTPGTIVSPPEHRRQRRKKSKGRIIRDRYFIEISTSYIEPGPASGLG